MVCLARSTVALSSYRPCGIPCGTLSTRCRDGTLLPGASVRLSRLSRLFPGYLYIDNFSDPVPEPLTLFPAGYI